MGSTRLPNKVMKDIGGRPMIEALLKRLSRSKEISQIVVATSDDARNLPLVDFVRALAYAALSNLEWITIPTPFRPPFRMAWMWRWCAWHVWNKRYGKAPSSQTWNMSLPTYAIPESFRLPIWHMTRIFLVCAGQWMSNRTWKWYATYLPISPRTSISVGNGY